MFESFKTFLNNLKLADAAVTPNFKPEVIDKLVRPSLLSMDQYKDSRNWKGCVVHHSATVDGRLNDWAGIKKYHMSYRIDGDIVGQQEFEFRLAAKQGEKFEKPWHDIGYHLGIEYELDQLKLRIGRPLSDTGAHAGIPGKNVFNETHIGICVVGNFDKAAPFPDEQEMLVCLIKELMAHYNFKIINVLGHREVYPMLNVPVEKTCPGTRFDMDKLRRAL